MNSFSVYRKRKKETKHCNSTAAAIIACCYYSAWKMCGKLVRWMKESSHYRRRVFHSILLLFFLSPLVVTLRFWHFVFSFCWTD